MFSTSGLDGWMSTNLTKYLDEAEVAQNAIIDPDIAEEESVIVKIALLNYERFHNMEPGTATVEQLQQSREGISWFASLDYNENVSNENM